MSLNNPARDWTGPEVAATVAASSGSDAGGEVRLTGLAPGEYSVKLFGGREETSLRVGQDGRLAFVAYEDITRPRGTTMQNGRRMPARSGGAPLGPGDPV
jgi:hypothetical protein